MNVNVLNGNLIVKTVKKKYKGWTYKISPELQEDMKRKHGVDVEKEIKKMLDGERKRATILESS